MIYDYKLFGLTKLDDTICQIYVLFDKINIQVKETEVILPRKV